MAVLVWVLVTLVALVFIGTVLAFFLAGDNRWPAALTGVAALTTGVALLSNERSNRLSIAPLILIE